MRLGARGGIFAFALSFERGVRAVECVKTTCASTDAQAASPFGRLFVPSPARPPGALPPTRPLDSGCCCTQRATSERVRERTERVALLSGTTLRSLPRGSHRVSVPSSATHTCVLHLSLFLSFSFFLCVYVSVVATPPVGHWPLCSSCAQP